MNQESLWGKPSCLSLIVIRGQRSGLQFLIRLLKQALGLLGVTVHIPFIGVLRCDDFFISLLAQSLSGGNVRMACAGNVPFGLRERQPANEDGSAENSREKASFSHRANSNRDGTPVQ